jgi:hypothetical protein
MKKIVFIAALLTSLMQADAPVTLTQAIIAGNVSCVDDYLTKEDIQINAPMGNNQDTALHFAIRAFIKELDSSYVFNDGLGEVVNGIVWSVAMPLSAKSISSLSMWDWLESINKDLEEVTYNLLVSAAILGMGYGAYQVIKGSGKIMFVVPYRAFNLYKRKKIIELLVQYPTIDVHMKNSKQQSSIDLLHFAIVKYAGNINIFNRLRSVELMILARNYTEKEAECSVS